MKRRPLLDAISGLALVVAFITAMFLESVPFSILVGAALIGHSIDRAAS